MRFEWDEDKNCLNQTRHDAFEFAELVLDDPLVLFRKDRIDEKGEQRWHAIGAVVVLLDVHVYRKENEHGEEKIRLISARPANKRERRIYLEQAAQ